MLGDSESDTESDDEKLGNSSEYDGVMEMRSSDFVTVGDGVSVADGVMEMRSSDPVIRFPLESVRSREGVKDGEGSTV